MAESAILNQLPGIEKCRRIFQSVALLDAIVMPDWEFRYYSFNANWDKNEMMASMRDGSSNHFFALFTEQGLIIKGFEISSLEYTERKSKEQRIEEVFRDVPAEFTGFLSEPAFIIQESTFCIWNLTGTGKWSAGKNYQPDELKLLRVLIDGAEGYTRWAEEYYERAIPLESVRYIFEFQRLTKDIIHSLNKDISSDDIQSEIMEIGYPGC